MHKKILKKILLGSSDKNIKFDDLRKIIIALGFNEKIKGDHHIFWKDKIEEIINLQPLKDGRAKPYQVKQVRELIFKYKLYKEDQDV